MNLYTFHFPEDPTGEKGELKITVFAESKEHAWERISDQLNIETSDLIDHTNPTIQMRQIKSGDLVVSKGTDIVADPDDPWPHIVSTGIKDITTAINSTVGTSQKERYELEKSYLGLDKIIIVFFLIAFLTSLGFSFFLIYKNNFEPISKFIYPLITAILGLITGYLAGTGRGGRSRRH